MKVLNGLSRMTVVDTEYQTEGVLILKALADNGK